MELKLVKPRVSEGFNKVNQKRRNMIKIIDLIENGLIQIGEELIWKKKSLSKTFKAKDLQSGQLQTEDGIKHKTPSGAARHLNSNTPIDGWHAWKIAKSNDSLDFLRKKLV
jgi:hypothetical protein